MKSMIKFYLIFFFSVPLFFACGDTEKKSEDEGADVEINDVSVNIADELSGSWLSTKVLRSGNEIEMGPFSLEYNIDENTFTSNLFDTDQNFPYEKGVKATLDGYSISFENLMDTFYIDNINEQDLILLTTIHDFPFEFIFEKK